MAGVFTDEKENFMRLVVLVNEEGAEAFQESLLHYSTQHYGVRTFDDVLFNAKRTLKTLRGKIITAQQWKTLYPPGGVSVQTSQLDITLCFVLLRNICGLIPPLTTWDKPPAPGDNSAEGGLSQLKNIRNFLCHSQKPELSDADFNTHFDNAMDAILNIERNIPSWTVTSADLLRYKTQAISPTLEADLLDVVNEWAKQDSDLRKEISNMKNEVTNLQGTVDSTKKSVTNVETMVKTMTSNQKGISSNLDKSLTRVKGMNDNLEKVGKDVKKTADNLNTVGKDIKDMNVCMGEVRKDVKDVKENVEKMMQSTTEKPNNTDVNGAYGADLNKELKGFYQRSMEHIQCDPLNPKKTMPLKDLVVNLVWFTEFHQSACGWPFGHYREMLTSGKKKRILVQGRAGMGKTTFGKVLVYDWSHGNEPCLERFESIFLLQMRLVKPEQSLVDMIKDQLLRRRPDLVEGLKDYIENNDECLFIFDGLDELGEKRTPEIDDIINGFYLRDAFVLFTSRPWLVQDLVSTDQSIDVHARIEGFDQKDVKKFIFRLFTNLSIAKRDPRSVCLKTLELFDQIKKRNLRDLVRIPIILNMICLLFHNSEELPNTMSKIYKSILELLFKRGLKLSKSPEGCSFHEIMMKLGKLAFEGLMKENDQLFFEYDEVIALVGEKAFEIGFVSCQMVKDRMGDDTQVQFLHKSFQEYIGAYYVAREVEKQNRQLWEKIKVELSTVEKLRNKGLLLEFLAGESDLLASKIQEYLDEMVIETLRNASIGDGDISQVLKLQSRCLRNMQTTLHPEKVSEKIHCDDELEAFAQSSNSIRWIYFKRYHFTEETVSLLSNVFDKNNSIVSVYIDCNREGAPEVLCQLINVLKTHKNVRYKYITLKSYHLKYGKKDWEVMFGALLGIKNMIGLVLSNCELPVTVFQRLGHIINTNSNTLYVLSLPWNPNMRSHFHLLSDKVKTKDSLVLSCLDLSYCLNSSDADFLSGFLDKAKDLKNLDLTRCNCDVTDSILRLEKLKILQVGDNTKGLDVKRILNSLPKMQMLEAFYAPDCGITKSEVERLKFPKSSKLKKLDVFNLHRPDEQILQSYDGKERVDFKMKQGSDWIQFQS